MENTSTENITINIPEEVNEILHTLQEKGHSAYIVGGCVRDSILGRTPNDWDICTSATPEEMMDVFKNEHLIPTGIKHGTLTLNKNNTPYEITTYRIDGVYSDNRRPDSVTFTKSLTEDLKRRDFTINAMAYNDEEGLIDPYKGLDDIKHKIIRCIENPEARFKEDALRMLRAIRFSSQLEFKIEPETYNEIYRQYKNIGNISIERINKELCKIAETKLFYEQLEKHQAMFEFIIPEMKPMYNFAQNNPHHDHDVYKHTVEAVKGCESDDLVVKLAVYFHDCGKPFSYQDDEGTGVRHFYGHAKVSAELTDRIMQRLKFPNAIREKVVELVNHHDSTLEPDKKNVKRWLTKISEDQFRKLLIVRKADIRGQQVVCDQSRIDHVNEISKVLDEVLNEEHCFSMKDLAINGGDLIAMGYKPGKELGTTLNKLFNMVVEEKCANDKDVLMKKAKTILENKLDIGR